MGFNCGIIGLPNVGKSTIFNALTNAGAQAENYPFCTIEPNVGVIPLLDPRLDKISTIYKPKKTTPTSLDFVDIAGLVQGASKGEGLGNKFLGHIRDVDAIAHIIRCFENPDVVNVHGEINPVHDAEVVNTELLLADLQTVTNRIDKNSHLARVGDKKAAGILASLEKVSKALNDGKAIRQLALDEKEKEAIADLFLLTAKPVLYVCNVDESHLQGDTESVNQVKTLAKQEGAEVVVICGNLEAEIAQMAADEKEVFLKDYGLKESGLDLLAHAGYKLLNLITFFTVNPNEARAWTILEDTLAPKAAGKVHTDFEKGFIRAEVCHYKDLLEHGSEHGVKEAGLLRSEGKDYLVQDGDIIYFRFNVS